MTQHVFAAIVTHHGVAANNRGETAGNITTLQKLLWNGKLHSSVSAEAIRFALRAHLSQADGEATNRQWDEVTRANTWQDPDFDGWKNGEGFVDDDLLGFMSAKAASQENQPGSTEARRAVLEITRAVSLIPWGGEITFNAASPGATPSAAKKGMNPVPYGAEIHATRYQYGVALTPSRLRVPARAEIALLALCSLSDVAGNHARFLFDFSPESVIFRITDDPAPRLLFIFEEKGGTVDAPALLRRVEAGDINAKDLVVGGAFASTATAGALKGLHAEVHDGVRAAVQSAVTRIGAET